MSKITEIALVEFTNTPYKNITVKTIKAQLKRRNIPRSGLKIELWNKLHNVLTGNSEYLSEQQAESLTTATNHSAATNQASSIDDQSKNGDASAETNQESTQSLNASQSADHASNPVPQTSSVPQTYSKNPKTTTDKGKTHPIPLSRGVNIPWEESYKLLKSAQKFGRNFDKIYESLATSHSCFRDKKQVKNHYYALKSKLQNDDHGFKFSSFHMDPKTAQNSSPAQIATLEAAHVKEQSNIQRQMKEGYDIVKELESAESRLGTSTTPEILRDDAAMKKRMDDAATKRKRVREQRISDKALLAKGEWAYKLEFLSLVRRAVDILEDFDERDRFYTQQEFGLYKSERNNKKRVRENTEAQEVLEQVNAWTKKTTEEPVEEEEEEEVYSQPEYKSITKGVAETRARISNLRPVTDDIIQVVVDALRRAKENPELRGLYLPKDVLIAQYLQYKSYRQLLRADDNFLSSNSHYYIFPMQTNFHWYLCLLCLRLNGADGEEDSGEIQVAPSVTKGSPNQELKYGPGGYICVVDSLNSNFLNTPAGRSTATHIRELVSIKLAKIGMNEVVDENFLPATFLAVDQTQGPGTVTCGYFLLSYMEHLNRRIDIRTPDYQNWNRWNSLLISDLVSLKTNVDVYKEYLLLNYWDADAEVEKSKLDDAEDELKPEDADCEVVILN